jgi:DNA topoisomerase-1
MPARAVVDGDPVAAARAVSLSYTTDDGAGLHRSRRGTQFRYTDARGKAVRDRATLSRIRALAIPPAWKDVWICPDANGHLQATGRDAKGRKQYRYHAKWRTVRDEAKYTRLVEFCHALPRVRAAVDKDLACNCLCKRKVVATIVALMERGQLRVGNDEYTRANGSYGATTLEDRHAKIRGSTLELAYKGKSGVARRIRLTDRRLARIVRACRDLPGQRLFQYVDGDDVRGITSTDVNDYLREVAGGPFTAKDYRTWAATLGATMMLCTLDHPDDERTCKTCVAEVIEAVAAKLGHTTAVCRSAYIHPRVIEDFMSGALARRIGRQVARRLHRAKVDEASAIEVDALRAIEPIVARYLAPIARRRHA